MIKLRVGVLMGGKSLEREVSLNSGRTICDHLDTQRYIVIPLFQTTANTLFILPWHFLHRGKISDFEQRLDEQATSLAWDDLKTEVDFIYIAMHGRYAEDGTLQGFLEASGYSLPWLKSFCERTEYGQGHAEKIFSSTGHTCAARYCHIT